VTKSIRAAKIRPAQPMIKATRRELEQIGVSDTPAVAVADSGYWHEEQIDQVVNMGTQVLIPPDAGKRDTPRRGWDGGRYAFMSTVLAGARVLPDCIDSTSKRVTVRTGCSGGCAKVSPRRRVARGR
jgi:hypothetical protein